MRTIRVYTSKPYDVIIGNNFLAKTGKYISDVIKPCKAAIISDTNVWPIYGATVSKGLEEAGFQVEHFVFPAGESSKTASTYLEILNFLAANQITRSDCVLALGGGVVGDLTGFAAATFLRGISYVQIPTSLLAMVDSSVGGKTAIDLPAGKNLAGAFYQPKLVLCDVGALDTLPEGVFIDGCAEVIKYGILYDQQMFSHLFENGLHFSREMVIARCIELKRDVVIDDEFDRGARQKLNLGHTIGHSIEAQSNFQITHGQAVAIGIDIVTKAAVSSGICQEDTYQQIHAILEKFCLPTTSRYSSDEIYTVSLSDKKRSGKKVNLIIPEAIGSCIIQPTPIDSLKSFIEAGL